MSVAGALFSFVTPLPPAASGIAQYSAELLAAIGKQWQIDVVSDGPTNARRRRWLPRHNPIAPCLDTPCVYQVGNSGFHSQAFVCARQAPGVLVLHDVVLHHGRLGEFVRAGRGREYRRLMADTYGANGTRLADDVLRGHVPPDFSSFPLCEDLVRRASTTVVHSEFARSLVDYFVPDAEVVVVPMGVPLPALIPADEARAALNVPSSAFVVASVTHVNPYKRLDVVLRALRKVVDVIPEAMLLVAGSVAPGLNLQQVADLYGVSRNVRFMGYVNDADARLVARASDVCVNLRHPSTGETSASLLRLLAAGKPVIITDDVSMAEYPRSACLRVPVDAFEEETLAEFLLMLADNPRLREAAGTAARTFVEREHSMDVTVGAYRSVLQRTFGFELPRVTATNRNEGPPVLAPQPAGIDPLELSRIEQVVVKALFETGIGVGDATIRSVAESIIDLRLDISRAEKKEGRSVVSQKQAIRQELLEILACPVCKVGVRLDDQHLVCDQCGRKYRIDDGIPVMLVDEAE